MNILKKLTVHNLKRNKVRTAVTILGITLALALITVVVGVFFSAWHSAIQSVILTSGDYDFSLMGEFTPEEVHQIESHRSVRDVYLFRFLEIAKNDDAKYQYTPYIYVYHADEAMLSANFCKLQEGRYPQKDNELLISSTLISHSEREYHVGDQLTLSIGKRVYDFSGDEHQKEMEEMYSTSNMSFYDPYMGQQYEKFNTTGTKTYTIVGILANEGGILNDLFMASSNMPSVFTYSPNGNAQGVYVRLQDSEESKYFQVASEMTGLSESDLEMIGKGQLELGDLNEILASSGKLHNITHFSLNRSLLTIKGLYESHDLQIMVSILAIIFGIVFLASVFIIRNSFAISITEKTKLYGMLSSVGATPKQISRNVFFEAAILGIIGIPLGILLGTGVTAGLLAICNALLGKTLGGLTLIFNIPWYAIMMAVLVGVVTIFASAAVPARKASKISPIEAIRSTQDVKTNEKKAGKIYRTPKFITKFLYLTSIFTILCVFTSCAVSSTSHTQEKVEEDVSYSNLSEDMDMPDIVLQTNQGSTFDLSKIDKPALVNFWATWCPPCRSEMPGLQNLYNSYKDKVDFILIDSGETEEDVNSFISEEGYTFPIAYDLDNAYSIKFNITAIPTTYIVGKDKKIKKFFLGATSEEDFKAALDSVINE